MNRATLCKLSEHLALEIEASRPEQPLDEGQPVPGCTCYRCVIQTFGLDDDTRVAAEDLACDLARLDPSIRLDVASAIVVCWLAEGLRLPAAGVLAELASRVDGARRSRSAGNGDKLQIDAARAVPILEVARRLGLELKRTGISWRGPCPIHDGEGSNFAVYPRREIFNCFVCGAKGDGIELYRRVRDVGFPRVVRELAK